MAVFRYSGPFALATLLLASACETDDPETEGSSGGSGGAGTTQGTFVVYPGCEETGEGEMMTSDGPEPGELTIPVVDERSLFALRVAPTLSAACRHCHVPGGVGDTDEGRRFMLSTQASEDYDSLKASWTTLGGGVTDSPILGYASGATEHSGGASWPEGSAPYQDVAALLTCWSDPSACSSALASRNGGDSSEELPLLGDLEANGGRNYAAVYCETKPDCATLPPDPRELITGATIESPDYAVYFNEPFEVCETEALFENQKRGNDLLIAQGKEPAYTAKRRPTTCGQWREAVAHGREYMVSTAITGEVLTPQSIINIGVNALNVSPVPTTPEEINETFASIAQQRYGWPPSPYDNPAPLPGEDPNETGGGSLQLPISMVQTKDDSGNWTGKLGQTCFSCHMSQIGEGEVVSNTASWDGHEEVYGGSETGLFLGMNGSNIDPALALWDTEVANGRYGENAFNAVLSNPPWLMERTRGSNAADQEIFLILLGRNFDTLDFTSPASEPFNGGKDVQTEPRAGGDQDVPSWWWTHNKTRYLWVGYGSNGGAREAFFPAAVNPNDGHWSKRREADFQDADMWINAIEAPRYVGPEIDTPLAEQGAILFHTKDLWENGDQFDVAGQIVTSPRPPGGNGSCASCHGAYSPRYIHQPGYLPDPRLAGMAAYTVPLETIGTDPEQSNLFELFGRDRESVTSISGSIWMGYPDAAEGYRMPEERTAGDWSPFPAGVDSVPGRVCGLGARGGYVAQPLHGVWASAPYFHNGSVPTVWDVLAPDSRPEIWRRQRVPESEATPGLGYRGFDTSLSRAYDYERLGWKYERLECIPGTTSYYLSCEDGVDVSMTEDPGPSAVDDRTIFNTNGYSKGNEGHVYTDVLTDDERRALVEYLKTL